MKSMRKYFIILSSALALYAGSLRLRQTLDSQYYRNNWLSVNYTTPQLLQALEAQKIHPEELVTHYFKLSQIEEAYDVFRDASKNNAIKVLIENDLSPQSQGKMDSI